MTLIISHVSVSSSISSSSNSTTTVSHRSSCTSIVIVSCCIINRATGTEVINIPCLFHLESLRIPFICLTEIENQKINKLLNK
ncbi:hypothetical protein PUN28_013531 [Cardiocondyla obscurior]|uniref:Uncharacterized protein n=1 Tax=Cardiocondyla obscurior TaxID=286306 RepID=A0AAW2F1Q8_9HYME